MPTNRPLIGITSSMSDNFVRMNKVYFNSVFNAGGLPVFLPYAGGAAAAKQYAREFDGILFAGGVDVNPAYYGEEVTGEGVEICDLRDEFELALLNEVKDTNLPLLGICRGIQLLNVGFGGSLWQHLPGHSQEESVTVREQEVNLVPGSLIHRLCGSDRILTNSFHHQAVKVPAPGFTVTAHAADGCNEALEPLTGNYEGRFILGVQWHPEQYSHLDDTAAAIFTAFVNAAKR